jgi:hypothetical protein
MSTFPPINVSSLSRPLNQTNYIRFAPHVMGESLGKDEVDEKARSFYTSNEWKAMTDYQRAHVLSTAAKFQHRNMTVNSPDKRINGKIVQLFDMDRPNTFNTINEEGIEQWPNPPQKITGPDEERRAYNQLQSWLRHEEIGQRQWGDRLYFGKMSIPKVREIFIFGYPFTNS